MTKLRHWAFALMLLAGGAIVGGSGTATAAMVDDIAQPQPAITLDSSKPAYVKVAKKGVGKAIAIGALILGGAIIANEAAKANERQRHQEQQYYDDPYDRCAAKFRSFRYNDGTYQPYGGGPREVCPYLY